MSPGKHGSNRYLNYVETHETVMQQFRERGFVLQDDLFFSQATESTIILEGTIHCMRGINISVQKQIAILGGDDRNPDVQSVSYSYNVALVRQGNIFRYDSPHATHNQEHHVHRYDVWSSQEIALDLLPNEDERPTLGEVIQEAEAWYYDNYDRLTTA